MTSESSSTPRAGLLWPIVACGGAILVAVAAVIILWTHTGTRDDTAAEPDAPSLVVVSMKNMQFDPAAATVRKGGTVEWRNDDLVPHTVTAAGRFESGPVPAGQTWRRTFADAGTFSYVCSFHLHMKASVVVK